MAVGCCGAVRDGLAEMEAGVMLTAVRLREMLHYDSASGHFTWISAPAGRKSLIGRRAGYFNCGYLSVMLDKRAYYCHRLAWLYMTGKWPTEQIDHIDLDKSNNSWGNLRQCTNSQNQANTRVRSNNKCGMKGVSLHSQGHKWAAQISARGKPIYLGLFETKEEAHDAYCRASVNNFGEFGRG